MEHEWRGVDDDREATATGGERAIELGEGERNERSAVPAAQVAGDRDERVGVHVSSLAVANIEPVGEAVAAQQLECVIDARAPEPPHVARCGLDFEHGERALGLRERPDHCRTGRAALMTTAPQRVLYLRNPLVQASTA